MIRVIRVLLPQKMKGWGWFLGNKPPPLKNRGGVQSTLIALIASVKPIYGKEKMGVQGIVWGLTPRCTLITSQIRKDCIDLVGHSDRMARAQSDRSARSVRSPGLINW